MTEGYIDSASTHQVVQLLWYNKPTEAYSWAWQSAITVSSAFINCRHLRMAPSPGLSGASSGPYGRLMLALSDLITQTRPNHQIQQRALRKTRRWATTNVNKVQSIYEDMKMDQENFSKWLDWSITYAWEEHSLRLGGLFDEEFLPQISRVLDVPEDYLQDVQRRSRDLDVVKHYAKHKPLDNDEFRVMSDVYVVSALLRGRYHDYVAQESCQQIIHHPIRQPMLPILKGKPISEFAVSNTEQYLSSIILAGAFAERQYENRISLWVESTLKARKAVLAGALDLRPKDHDEVALDLAVKAAKQLGIRTYPERVETILDAAVALGFGILTTFVLVGWEGLLATPVEFVISQRLNIGKSGARLLYGAERRLHDLAKSEPGRIEQRRKK